MPLIPSPRPHTLRPGRPALLAASALMALGLPAGAQTLRAVMHSDLRVIDPIITTAYITRNHGYMGRCCRALA